MYRSILYSHISAMREWCEDNEIDYLTYWGSAMTNPNADMQNNELRGNAEALELIEALDSCDVIKVLMELCKDDALAERIAALARGYLSGVDADEIAEKVFRSLNAIQIENLWHDSGESYWGYHDITEVAFEMIGDEVDCFVKMMHRYKNLGMKKEEKEYCKGIIAGLFQYGESGSNEFHNEVPDDPYIHAENILYNWKQNSTAEDGDEIQAFYDSFFINEVDSRMKILVDADACPVKQIVVRLAGQKDIPVTMLFDTSHDYTDGYSKVISVDQGTDSVDFALMALLNPGDVVVTQDYGLGQRRKSYKPKRAHIYEREH